MLCHCSIADHKVLGDALALNPFELVTFLHEGLQTWPQVKALPCSALEAAQAVPLCDLSPTCLRHIGHGHTHVSCLGFSQRR